MKKFLKKYEIKANAKINLGLNILNKLENGYHEIDTIMVPIDLSDILKIDVYDEEIFEELILESNVDTIPLDENNIIYKVYNKFYEISRLKKRKIKVFIEKNIPSEAGLGGGSSDGVFFLKFLNELHGNIFTLDELSKIATSIGSDLSFFVYNKPARVRGYGDKIELIEGNIGLYNILLVKPENIGISTKFAYEIFDNIKEKNHAPIEQIIQSLLRHNITEITNYIANNLEDAIMEYHDEMKFFKKMLENVLPSKKFFMSGSGSTFFAFIKKEEEVVITTRINTFMDQVKVYSCKI